TLPINLLAYAGTLDEPGREEELLAVIEKGLQLEAMSAFNRQALYRMRARVHLRRREEALARADLAAAEQLDEGSAQEVPPQVETHFQLGNWLLEMVRLDEATAEYREFIRLKPERPNVHNSLGYVLSKKGQLDEAIAEYQEAIRLKPDHEHAHNNLGNALMEKGRLDDAIAEYQEAIRLKPTEPAPHSNLGIALMEKGRLEEAIAEYEEALRLRPDMANAHNNLGVAFYKKGQLKEAIAEYQEAIRVNPQSWYGYGNLAGLLADAPQPEFRDSTWALSLAQKAVELAPKERGAY